MITQAFSLSSRSVHNVVAAAEILERGDDLGSVTNLAFDLGFTTRAISPAASRCASV